jgi:quinol monooxygenase YgiN
MVTACKERCGMSSPVKTIGILVAHPGRAADLRALLLGMTAACRAEPGNLHWDVWQDQADARRFVINELYKNDAAVAFHHETTHFKAYAAQINDIAERTVLMLDAVDVA